MLKTTLLVAVLLVSAAAAVPLVTHSEVDGVSVRQVYDCSNSTGPNPNPVRIHEETGYITDGDGPYLDYLSCYWLVEALGCVDCQVRLTYSVFDLENSYDYVQHYSDQNFGTPMGGRHTGKTIPPPQTSPGPFLGVEFSTDHNNPGGPYDGFYAAFEILNYNPGPKTYYCDGANATSLIRGTEGTVASNSGPHYGSNWVCTWKIEPPVIEVPSKYYLEFVFRSFSLEQGFDQVRLYRGVAFDAAKQIESTFNSVNRPVLNNDERYNSGEGMSISFNTDFSNNNNYAGFVADYRIVETTPTYYCDGNVATVTTALNNAVISDRAGYYGAGWNCRWVLPGGANKQVTLKFSEFSTRTYVDYVRVYDDTTFTTLKHSFHGSTLPVNVVSAVGRGLSVTFITSTSYSGNAYPGFTAEYKVYDLTP